MSDVAETTRLRDQVTRFRKSGQPVAALRALLDDPAPDRNPSWLAFRHHCLGGNSAGTNVACLLLDAVTPGSADEVRDLLGALTHQNKDGKTPLCRFLTTPRLQHLLNARLSILAAATNQDTATDIHEQLLNAVRLYSAASPQDVEAEEERQAKLDPKMRPEPAFLTQLNEYWVNQLKDVEAAWRAERQRDTHPDWDDPAVLFVGETLAFVLNKGQLPQVGEPVQTWVLLASPYEIDHGGSPVEVPDGLLARLVIEKVPGGDGLLIPDCRYNGYLPLDASFQRGLRNVMRVLKQRTKKEWTEQAGMTYDYRWRLIPLSPEDGHQQPVLLGAVDGRSAELAFACAIRASLMNERLDPHVAITARFEEPGAAHERLFHVGGVSHKVLGLRQGGEPLGASVGLKEHRIDQIVLASDDPFAMGGDKVQVHQWTMQIATAETFDDAYRRLSDDCRITDQYRAAVLWSTRQWFQRECFGSGDKTDPTGAYRLNDFRLRAMNPAADEKSVPFSRDRLGQLIRGEVRDALSLDGRAAWRANIVADSGMGKTSLLVYIAHQTASEHGVRIPIRVEQLSTFLSVPRRDSFLEAAVAEVHSLLTDYQQHDSPESKVPTRESLIDWLDVATRRAEVVWLMDALDQMSEHQSHLKRFTDEFDECAVLLTMRQEALSSSPLRDRGQTLDLQPFTTATAKAYLGVYADLFFERLPISDRGEPEDGHVLTIPLLLHLLRQLAIDLDLDPRATQIDHTAFRNRYRIYDLALIHEGGLVDKGCRSLALRKDLDAAKLDNKRRAIKCLREMALRQMRAGHVDTRVSGRLYEDLASHLDSLSNDAEDAFKQINVVTQLPAFDQHPLGGLKWRHRSFLEFFAGCQLAELPLEALKREIDDHARDDKWSWCLRFAVSKIEVDAPEQIDVIAECLLEAGAPFLLWTMIDQDGITVTKPLDDLCRWLVHRDRDSWKQWSDPETSPWAGRPEDQRPTMTDQTAAILAKMFAVGEPEPWKRRDSRWLHPAWQLVVENLPLLLPSPPGRGAGGEGRLTRTVTHNPSLSVDLRAFARELRRTQTDAEMILWELLRDRQLFGQKFRRQHPVQPYVLDFYCQDCQLAIEVDGADHNTDEARLHDERRTAFLRVRGIRVIRFWNHDVREDIEAVLLGIWKALFEMGAEVPDPETAGRVLDGEEVGGRTPSPPAPLPGGEGGRQGNHSPQEICQAIHDQFLGEFEQRVREAATRNQWTLPRDWRADDQGLLQLVPDDVLRDLGVITSHQYAAIREWPSSSYSPLPPGPGPGVRVNGDTTPAPGTRSYAQRRDTFNQQLKDHRANFCACPPVGWEHPYLNEDGSERNVRECYVSGTGERTLHPLPERYELQRTPVTNRQWEAFDPFHSRTRRIDWKRGAADNLDDHPVMEVSWYQSRMLCVWLTGHGAFGTFGLPLDEDWEACCRAGRDWVDQRREYSDDFGIPLCDEQQQPILDTNGQEQFHSLSSHGANFHGDYPDGPVKNKGPYLKGIVPVGQYPANGFGLVDQHGQVYEWIQNAFKSAERSIELFASTGSLRSVRGGNWFNFGAWYCRASNRDRFAPDVHHDDVGVRVSSTAPAGNRLARIPAFTDAGSVLLCSPRPSLPRRRVSPRWPKDRGRTGAGSTVERSRPPSILLRQSGARPLGCAIEVRAVIAEKFSKPLLCPLLSFANCLN